VPVPDPPDPFDPLTEVWPAGQDIVRIHDAQYEPNAFNTTATPSRFRPVHAASGRVVPTLYGASGLGGALSETVFHDISPTSERVVAFAEIERLLHSILVPLRDLLLIKLLGDGLTRLRVRNAQVVDVDDPGYLRTRLWGQACYEWRAADGEAADGIVWMSRQFNSERAIMLFGTLGRAARVSSGALEIRTADSFQPLALPPLLDQVYEAANRADVTIVRSS
jgi:hypothetical protein